MDLDPDAEAVEHDLQDHNERLDELALFGTGTGSNANVAIDVDAVLPSLAGTVTAPSSPTATGGSTARDNRPRKRLATSRVWVDFEEVTGIDEKGKKVRISAICKHYKCTLSARSSSGTGHLLRHQEHCKAEIEHDQEGIVQSVLKFNPNGFVQCWEYSALVARTEMCRLIAREDLPLCFAESDASHEYITRAHNPRFVKSSRQTIARDLIKHNNGRMERLIETLKSSVSSLALTSDIWSGKAKEDYISVVAHYVNSNWGLEKRLLGLRPIEFAHTGSNIAEHISMVVDDYGIVNNFFAITLDNASSNKTAMSLLQPMFTSYLDFGCNDILDLDDGDALSSIFLHQRCACHIINLIVKSSLKRLKPYLNDFRTAITFLNASNQRIAAYKIGLFESGCLPS
jgi:hypothetical protein